jgi:hypothetical protein
MASAAAIGKQNWADLAGVDLVLSHRSCSTLAQQTEKNFGTRFLQVHQVDEQMTDGMIGLAQAIALAAVSNRTFVEPIVGSAELKSYYQTPCSLLRDRGGGSGVQVDVEGLSLSTVINLELLRETGNVRIIPLDLVQRLEQCGLWSTPERPGGNGSRCCACDHDCPEYKPGKCISHPTRSMAGSHGWYYDAVDTNTQVLELCCVTRAGRGGLAHFSEKFPREIHRRRNKPDYVVEDIKFQFSASLLGTVDKFFLGENLVPGSYIGVHWRSEMLWNSHGRNSAGADLLRNAAAIIISNIKRLQKGCKVKRVFFAVDFLEHGSSTLSYQNTTPAPLLAGGHGDGSYASVVADDSVTTNHLKAERLNFQVAKREALLAVYNEIVMEVDAVVFDAKRYFPQAQVASNSMAIAAAEMTILAKSKQFYPIVAGGQFVFKTRAESLKPSLIGPDSVASQQNRCGAILEVPLTNTPAETEQMQKHCRNKHPLFVCPRIALSDPFKP